MTLIADIVHDITANPAPVLFLDTCILLDIVRAPLRNKPSEIQFARLFLTALQKTPKTIHLLVASPTQREWTDHIAETENDCTIAVNSCNAVASICGHMALPPVASLPAGVLTLSTCGGVTDIAVDWKATYYQCRQSRVHTRFRYDDLRAAV